MNSEGSPIKGVDISVDTDSASSPIPRRKRPIQEPNGHSQNGAASYKNGTDPDILEVGAPSKKRTATEALEDSSPSQKRSKRDDDVIAIDDTDNGAILIDDD